MTQTGASKRSKSRRALLKYTLLPVRGDEGIQFSETVRYGKFGYGIIGADAAYNMYNAMHEPNTAIEVTVPFRSDLPVAL